MRKIFLFVILLCWGIVGFTQDGVNFEHLSFKEALDKAQAENCGLLYFLVWSLSEHDRTYFSSREGWRLF